MYRYQFDEFTQDIDRIVTQLGDYRPDIILAIARGGVTFGHFLSEILDLRALYTLNSIHYDGTMRRDDILLYNIPKIPPKSNVLVVDDIVDSGDTMREVMATLRRIYPESDFKSASLFYKESAAFIPDFKARHADEWIHFFWNGKNQNKG